MNRRDFLAAAPVAALGVSGSTGGGAAASPPPSMEWPDAAQIREAAREYADALVAERPIFRHFLPRDVNESVLAFEILSHKRRSHTTSPPEEAVFAQHERGRGAMPTPVVLANGTVHSSPAPSLYEPRVFWLPPGVYGEYMEAPVSELVDGQTPTGLVMSKLRTLVGRRVRRMELACWSFAITGRLRNYLDGGWLSELIHRVTADPSWDVIGAEPAEQLVALSRFGTGSNVVFDEHAVAYASRRTCNHFARRMGVRLDPDEPLVTFQARLDVVTRNAKAPRLMVNSQVYPDDIVHDPNAPQYIPHGTVVVFGRRAGAYPCSHSGEYRFTRNANNPDLAPGPYTRLIEHETGHRQVHDGHNGGAVLYYPSDIIVFNVLRHPERPSGLNGRAD